MATSAAHLENAPRRGIEVFGYALVGYSDIQQVLAQGDRDGFRVALRWMGGCGIMVPL